MCVLDRHVRILYEFMFLYIRPLALGGTVQNNQKTGLFAVFSTLGPFAHPRMDPKRYAKVRKWAGCMAQCQSLKIGPNQIIRSILLEEMVKNNQKIVFYAVFSHLGTPKWTQNGTRRPSSGQDL
jgi:hypothetical protein